jgi:hypothetical protein
VSKKVKKAPAAFWGTRLGIAGFGMDFKSDHAGVISIFKKRYGRFGGAGYLEYKLDVSEAPGSQNPFKPAVLFDGRVLKLERGDFEAVLDTRTGVGKLKASSTEQCLDAFLRSLISFLLIRDGGFMLHSAGLVKNGKAYIFPGKSGAGKSTLSKLAASSRGVEVISDEINLLRFRKGRWRVYGSPFWGEMRADGRPGSWPLGGIFSLRKTVKNNVSSCPGAEAFRALLRCAVNFSRDAETAGLALATAARLASTVSLRRLEFSKRNADFLELIR